MAKKITYEDILLKLNKGELEYGNGDFLGIDGNAFSLIAYVQRCLKKAGWDKEHRGVIKAHMTAYDYAHLLSVGMSVLKSRDDSEDW